jgi:hypothetical protein
MRINLSSTSSVKILRISKKKHGVECFFLFVVTKANNMILIDTVKHTFVI